MSKVNISIEELFELGAHFGHRKRFWNPHMEDYIFCEKNNIHIIDLYKTQEKIVELYETFRKFSSVGNKIMIVGTKRVASSYVTDFGEKNRHALYITQMAWRYVNKLENNKSTDQ
jgi:small subunit ribosomal protein S2